MLIRPKWQWLVYKLLPVELILGNPYYFSWFNNISNFPLHYVCVYPYGMAILIQFLFNVFPSRITVLFILTLSFHPPFACVKLKQNVLLFHGSAILSLNGANICRFSGSSRLWTDYI